MHLDVAEVRTTMIRASVHDVEVTLVISVILVILVVFCFLRSVWATAIPSVVVPLSLVGTFGVMYLLHYSIDNLSLMALTISTGFVVDDAIVVIENISRYLEQGLSPDEAALRGSREIGFTVLSMSTSLIAVFIPILLMGGILGRIFREFAVTLSVAVAISMVVSLTTTPAMCAKFLKAEKDRKHNWLYRASERGFQWLHDGYARASVGYCATSRWCWASRWAPSAWRFISTWSFPKASFRSRTPGASMATPAPAKTLLSSHVAEGASNTWRLSRPIRPFELCRATINRANAAYLSISLKPLSERKVSVFEVINRLRPKLARVPGATLFMTPQQDVQIGGRSGNAQFQYTLQGDNLRGLARLGARGGTEAANDPGDSGCE